MYKITVAVAAAILSAGSPAHAEAVTANPAQIASILQAAGFQGLLGTDSTGDPMVTSAVSGTKFVVLFYNCTDHRACATIQFQTAWSMKIKPTATQINDWNFHNRFARAYIDKEGDPGIMMDLNLDKGGLSPALFRDNFDVWASIVPLFVKHIGFKG